jgi:hypothetical protein
MKRVRSVLFIGFRYSFSILLNLTLGNNTQKIEKKEFHLKIMILGYAKRAAKQHKKIRWSRAGATTQCKRQHNKQNNIFFTAKTKKRFFKGNRALEHSKNKLYKGH